MKSRLKLTRSKLSCLRSRALHLALFLALLLSAGFAVIQFACVTVEHGTMSPPMTMRPSDEHGNVSHLVWPDTADAHPASLPMGPDASHGATPAPVVAEPQADAGIPSAAPVPSARSDPPEALGDLVCSYSWSCADALLVAECESTLRPWAMSSDGSNAGIMQVNITHLARIERMGYAWNDMLLVGPNLDVAHAIWLEQGWGPWRGSGSCHGLS